MAGAKIVVLYPAPRDVATFERAYTQDHAPMVTPNNFKGMTKFVASKIVGTLMGVHRRSTESRNFIFHRWQPFRRRRLPHRPNRRSLTPFRSRVAAHLFFSLRRKKRRVSKMPPNPRSAERAGR
jgi:hypothetical protein